jgi:exonuclease VII small subunit
LSYHNFLYPTIDVTRVVLMWLVQALPSRDVSAAGDSIGGSGSDALLRERITQVLAASLDELWVPSFCRSARRRALLPPRAAAITVQLTVPTRVGVSAEAIAYFERYQRVVSSQGSRRVAALSILHHGAARRATVAAREADYNANALASGVSPSEYRARKRNAVLERMRGALRDAYSESAQKLSLGQLLAGYGAGGHSSKFGHHSQFDQESSEVDVDKIENESEEDVLRRRAAEIEELEALVTRLSQGIAALESSLAEYAAAMQQLKAQAHDEEEARAPLEKEYKVKKKTFDLLPDADNNIKKLRAIADESGEALLALAAEWEARRVPLIERYRALVDANARIEEKYAERLEKIKQHRAELKQLVGDVREADERFQQMAEAVRSLPKEARRTMYTKRILFLLAQVKKQNVDIQNALVDTRALQKELNSISEKLNRTFAMASELVFSDAKKNETAKAAFIDLAKMNESFKQLSQQVEETGRTRNAVLSLEADIGTTTNRVAKLDVERMQKDLDDVEAANEDAVQRLHRAKLL